MKAAIHGDVFAVVRLSVTALVRVNDTDRKQSVGCHSCSQQQVGRGDSRGRGVWHVLKVLVFFFLSFSFAVVK